MNTQENNQIGPEKISTPVVNFEIPPSFHLEWKLEKSAGVPHFFRMIETFLDLGKPKIVDPESGYQPIDLAETFGLNAPIQVEIGCGKGSYLVGSGEKNPEHNIIGIDSVASIAQYAAERVGKRPNLKNIRVLEGEAHVFIEKFLPLQSVSAFHMYFPDPWPKKRHLKRRSLTIPFLKSIQKAATPEALFYWATDFTDYHEQAQETFLQANFKVVEEFAQPTFGVETNFEKKYKLEGRPIHRSVYRIN